MNPGVAYALGAYMLWGLFPPYFKLLHQVPALHNGWPSASRRWGWAG